MNIPDLEAFAVVVETGSIVAASARLHLTQPGVTRRVQNLEEALGATLLERKSKPLRPTADGRKAYELARRVLSSVADLRSAIAGGAELSGDLRIGVTSFLADRELAIPFEKLRAEFPKLSVYLTTAWSPELLADVEAGQLDAAIVCLPADAEPSRELVRESLSQHPLLFVASPALSIPHRPSLSDLSAFPWVVSQDGCGMRRILRRAFEAAGLPFRVAVEALSPEFRLSLVARGVGLGLTSVPALWRSPLREALHVLDVADFKAAVRVWLVHRQTTGRLLAPLSVLQQALLAVLESTEEAPDPEASRASVRGKAPRRAGSRAHR